MHTIQAPKESRGDICIGRRGENAARQVVFDLSAFAANYGDGTPQLLHQRKGDRWPYLVQAAREGDALTWIVTSADTAVAGGGRTELRWYVGDTLAKSQVWPTSTLPALADPDGSAPEEYHSDIELLIDGAGEAVNRAEAAADRVEQAAAQAGYMFFEVDQRGHLIYNRTDNVTADFSIVGGRLIYHGD